MKLLIFSDSHCHTELMENLAVKYKSVVNGILHLGDCTEDILNMAELCGGIPIYQVRGNNDFDHEFPLERILDLYGHKIFMTHGHRQKVYYNTDLLYYSARQCDADIALFGHTHVPYLKNEGGIIVMNPGSISLPRSNTGKTFGFLTFESGKTEAAIMHAENKNIIKIAALHV